MRNIFVLVLLSILFFACTDHRTPLEKSDFQKLTSHQDMMNYVKELSDDSDLMELDTLTLSNEGRVIPFIKVSTSGFGKDTNKIKVMIFAQQHGNEQSGKEALINILKRIYESKLTYVLGKIDLLLIPQMNPDGSELDERRNGNDADLNRDHLLLSQPETIALHQLFKKYEPQVTLDIHEYRPFSKSWEAFGFQKNWDEQFGTLTNINVDDEILNFQKKKFIPYIQNFLEERDFTFNEYVVGGPPNLERMRYSTIDINDGRQSFGILNSMSFILEGLNGRTSVENIERRTEGQIRAVLGFLEFVYNNKNEIRDVIRKSREDALKLSKVAIRLEHIKGDEQKFLSLLNLKTDTDTTLLIDNFHAKVISKLDVEKPKGYLIPKKIVELKTWLDNHGIFYEVNHSLTEADQYTIENFVDSVDEELENQYPQVSSEKININPNDYYFVPTKQLHTNMLVIALEPQSQIGLIQYDLFKEKLTEENKYTILRIE